MHQLGLAETKTKKCRTEGMVPGVRSLSKAIKRFSKKAHMTCAAFIHKARWVDHINRLSERSMEEGIAYIELMQFPSFKQRKMEYCTNGDLFDDGAEGFTIV